jgi:hypothetical protein
MKERADQSHLCMVTKMKGLVKKVALTTKKKSKTGQQLKDLAEKILSKEASDGSS